MLRSIAVKDFAIIAAAALDFGPGMTVLSGETGAGKSLLVDALLLLSGARGDASWVRAGAERAELSAEFELASDAPALALLRELEVDDGGECRLRRVIRADGASRAFVNDRAVSVQVLRQLAASLIEIHGQHEQQALLERAGQLALLDAFGGHGAELAAVATATARWRALQAEAQTLGAAAGADGGRLDWLRFQLDELERDALAPDALRALEDEHRQLSHAGDLISGCEQIAATLDGEGGAAIVPALLRAEGELRKLAQLDRGLEDAAATLADAAESLRDSARTLERYGESRELDPDRLAAVDAQLGRIHALARKHRVGPAELFARAAELRAEHDQLAHADERLAVLSREIENARAQWNEAATALTTRRTDAARRLGASVSAAIGELGMGGGRFEVALERASDGSPQPGGAEGVEFLVSANPGQPPRALRKVASGGELSRISLAIEVAALGNDAVPSMVFDEVDAGIGGAVAEVVGVKLRTLAGARQVLCVTHLPQVAAQAHHHVAVAKSLEGGATRTRFVALDAKARAEELARMLGGVEITAQTRAHAQEMLKRAAKS